MFPTARRLLLAALLVTACAPPAEEGTPDAGNVTNQKIVDISGRVLLHPLEVAWREANETTASAPSLGGVTVNIEDAVRAKAGLAPLKVVTADAEGKFTATEVDVKVVTIAILASVRGEGLFFSGYGLQRGRPSANLVDMPVYVFSNAFIDAFTGAISSDAAGMKQTGFALGTIVDTAGVAIAGAAIAKTSDPTNPFEGDETIGVLYPNDDLSAVAATKVTGAKGVVVLTNAGDAKDYTAIKAGKTFEEKLTGSRENAVVSFFVHELAQ